MIETALSWLPQSQSLLAFAQLVAAAVTAWATFRLWRVTGILADETKLLAAMSSRPFVVAAFEPSAVDPQAMNFVIRNTGNATAFGIICSITPALPKADGTLKATPDHESRGISLIPPGQAISIQGILHREAIGMEFAISISWAQHPEKKEREEIKYITRTSDGHGGGWKVDGVHKVANELEAIRRQMSKK